MKRHLSAEAHLAALDAILDRWRADPDKTEFYRQFAIAEIKRLGHSEDDAGRWLAGAVRKPARPRAAA